MSQQFNFNRLFDMPRNSYTLMADVGTPSGSSSGGEWHCPDGWICTGKRQPHDPFVLPHHDPTMLILTVVSYLLTLGVGYLLGRARGRAQASRE